MAKKKRKIVKRKPMMRNIYQFLYQTEYGHWNPTKSFYESAEQFKEIHKFEPASIIRLNYTKTKVPKMEKSINAKTMSSNSYRNNSWMDYEEEYNDYEDCVEEF